MTAASIHSTNTGSAHDLVPIDVETALPMAAAPGCPSCSACVARGARICVQCGWDFRSRTRRSTRRERALEADDTRRAHSRDVDLAWVVKGAVWTVLLLVIPLIGLATDSPVTVAGGAFVLAFATLFAWLWALVDAAGRSLLEAVVYFAVPGAILLALVRSDEQELRGLLLGTATSILILAVALAGG